MATSIDLNPLFKAIFNKISSLKESLNNSANECDITAAAEEGSFSKEQIINDLENKFTKLKSASERIINKLKSNLSDLASLVEGQKKDIQVKL